MLDWLTKWLNEQRQKQLNAENDFHYNKFRKPHEGFDTYRPTGREEARNQTYETATKNQGAFDPFWKQPSLNTLTDDELKRVMKYYEQLQLQNMDRFRNSPKPPTNI